MKKALITGQDGSCLAEQTYEVHGLVRRASSFNTQRLDAIYRNLQWLDTPLNLHYGDVDSGGRLANLMADGRPDIQPDEVRCTT